MCNVHVRTCVYYYIHVPCILYLSCMQKKSIYMYLYHEHTHTHTHTHTYYCMLCDNMLSLTFAQYLQQSLEEQLKSPDCLLVDLAKLEAPQQLHTAFLALHHFTLSNNGTLPRARYVYIMYIISLSASTLSHILSSR